MNLSIGSFNYSNKVYQRYQNAHELGKIAMLVSNVPYVDMCTMCLSTYVCIQVCVCEYGFINVFI